MANRASERPPSITEAAKFLRPGVAQYRLPTRKRSPTKSIPVHLFGRKNVKGIATQPITPSIPGDVPWSPVPQRMRGSTFADRGYPWCAIGRVDTPVGHGTGCLVGPRHLLTASHLVKWLPDNRAGSIRFRPAFNSDQADADVGEASDDVFATAVTVYKKIEVGSPPGIANGDVSADMALCILERRVGDELGWLGTRVYDDESDDESHWANVGYPSCQPNDGLRPIYDSGAPLESQDCGLGTVIRCAGAMASGHSGGSVFAFWPDGPYSIGVYSSSGTIGEISDARGHFLAGGELLVRLVRKMREDFP